MVASAYVIAMSLVLPRVLRAVVLHARPVTAAEVLRGPRDASSHASPVRRLAALGAGGAVSALLAGIALSAASSTVPGSYQHAIGSLAVLANAALLLATLLPLPGLSAWDGAAALGALWCPDASHLPAHTAHAATAVALVLGGVLALLSLALGTPMLSVIGVATVIVVWSRAEATLRLDHAARFLRSHTAADLAAPVTAVRRVDDRIADLTPAARTCPSLVIDGGALFVGVIGLHQFKAAVGADTRCGDVMVPARAVPIVQGNTPASDLARALEDVGVVLVRGDSRYGAIDADDVRRRIRASADTAVIHRKH